MRNFFDFFNRHRYTFVTLFLGSLYFWLLIISHSVTYGDFKFFADLPLNFTYGIDRWYSWSSRLLIESSANVFSKNVLVWQVLTVAAGAVLFWSIGRLLNNRRIWQSILVFTLLLLTGTELLASAGIFATTINYLWPLACFAFVTAIVLNPFASVRLNVVAKVIAIPMFIFAVCNEQIALLGILLLVAYIVYNAISKIKIPMYVWVLLGLSVLAVVNILVSPGNDSRVSHETNLWWPGFEDVGTTKKIMYGMIVTFSRLFLAPELLSIVAIIAILLLAFRRKNIQAFIAALPAMVLSVLFFFPETAGTVVTTIRQSNYFNEIRNNALFFSPSNLPSDNSSMMYLVIFVAICFSIIVSICFLYGKTTKALTIVILLFSGIAVSLAVSLSPTLFASSTRTVYFMVMILLVVNSMLLKDFISESFFDNSTPRPLKG
jgi:hypothetical protein